MDSRLRGNDETLAFNVIPAKAGISLFIVIIGRNLNKLIHFQIANIPLPIHRFMHFPFANT